MRRETQRRQKGKGRKAKEEGDRMGREEIGRKI